MHIRAAYIREVHFESRASTGHRVLIFTRRPTAPARLRLVETSHVTSQISGTMLFAACIYVSVFRRELPNACFFPIKRSQMSSPQPSTG